jgi:two-component system CheB/CheR fusion protein
VAFLDIGMRDGMDGCEVARRLRQLPGGDKTVLVAVTGYGREEDVRRCEDAGIDHHFTKPVDPEKLERLLDEAKEALGRTGRVVEGAKAVGERLLDEAR